MPMSHASNSPVYRVEILKLSFSSKMLRGSVYGCTKMERRKYVVEVRVGAQMLC